MADIQNLFKDMIGSFVENELEGELEDELGYGKHPAVSATTLYPRTEPIEMLWDEIREKGFRNEVFISLEKVVDRLCQCVRSLTCNPKRIASITHRQWLESALII